jgi:hypothetical protein
MFIETFQFPGESIRCQRGDYILQRGAGGRVRVYRVEDLVKMSRLVPYGQDALIEEVTMLDSERPAYMGEVHLLLTAFDRELASPEEATQSIDAGNLGPSTGEVCMDIRSFPTSNSQVYRLATAGQR